METLIDIELLKIDMALDYWFNRYVTFGSDSAPVDELAEISKSLKRIITSGKVQEEQQDEDISLTEAELETALETDNFVRTQLEMTEEDCDAEPDIITEDDLAELETEWQKQEAERIGNVH